MSSRPARSFIQASRAMAWGSTSSRPDVAAGLCGVARPPGCPAGFYSAPGRRAKGGGGGGGLVRQQRQSASQREKMRMRHLAQALHTLRRYLPASVAPAGHSLTKIETLRLAIRYIGHLSELLGLSEAALPQRLDSPGRRHCRRCPPWAPRGGWADGAAADADASPDLAWEPWAGAEAEEPPYYAQQSPRGGQTPLAGSAPAAAEPWAPPAAPPPRQRPLGSLGAPQLGPPPLPSPGTGAAPFLEAEQAAAAATWNRLAGAWAEADQGSQVLPAQHQPGFYCQGQR